MVPVGVSKFFLVEKHGPRAQCDFEQSGDPPTTHHSGPPCSRRGRARVSSNASAYADRVDASASTIDQADVSETAPRACRQTQRAHEMRACGARASRP